MARSGRRIPGCEPIRQRRQFRHGARELVFESDALIAGGGEPQRITTAFVSASLISVLGVPPLLFAPLAWLLRYPLSWCWCSPPPPASTPLPGATPAVPPQPGDQRALIDAARDAANNAQQELDRLRGLLDQIQSQQP